MEEKIPEIEKWGNKMMIRTQFIENSCVSFFIFPTTHHKIISGKLTALLIFVKSEKIFFQKSIKVTKYISKNKLQKIFLLT